MSAEVELGIAMHLIQAKAIEEAREQGTKSAERRLDVIRCQLMDTLIGHFERHPDPVTFAGLRKKLKHLNPEKKAELAFVLKGLVEAELVVRIPSEPGERGPRTVRYQYVG